VGTAEALRCAWCGVPHDVASRPLGGRTVCAHCGVATTDPWPTDAQLDVAYEGWYRPGSGRFDAGGDILLRLSRGALSARLDRLAPPGPILDVGCGDGHLVGALRRRGRRAVGLERVSTGPDVIAGVIDDVEGEGTWAAVVFWHSLEHLPAAGHALDIAAKLLAPDGVLIVAVPNAGSWQAKAFGERWFALDLPRHLVHIPARALSRRLARNQIAVERVSHYRGGQVVFGWLHGLVGAFGGYDLYDAIRRSAARRRPMSLGERLAALGMGVVLTPLAAACALVEVAARRGGTVYVEGRRA
jgi:SAM-dependent methyltransferase